MATVYERAFFPEGSEDCLTGGLTIDELAYLRAGYFGGVDHSLCEELKARMNSMVRAGLLVLEGRTETVRTLGGWFVRWPFKGCEGMEFQPPAGTISKHGSGPISDEYEQEINVEVKPHHVVTREAAVSLKVIDPLDWSDGADLWLRTSSPLAGVAVVGTVSLDSGADGDELLKKEVMIRVLVDEEGFTDKAVRPKLDHPGDNTKEGEFLHGCKEGTKWWCEKTRRAFISHSGLARDKPKARPRV